MKFKLLLLICAGITSGLYAQKTQNTKGNLFIIGGGNRSAALIKKLISTAGLKPDDYIVVLPMASEIPNETYAGIKTQLQQATTNKISAFNFNAQTINSKILIDSLTKAKLIFIPGGSQDRFMAVVANTPVYNAIKTAYKNGATIAGTSAGAAVMSKLMITGQQLAGDTTYKETFNKLWDKNIEFKDGLGLLDSVIIDQHFLKRSRYNRLISALAAHPKFNCIGIDEATAIIVHGRHITVTGDSQVIRLRQPEKLMVVNGLIKWDAVKFSIYTAGDSFDY